MHCDTWKWEGVDFQVSGEHHNVFLWWSYVFHWCWSSEWLQLQQACICNTESTIVSDEICIYTIFCFSCQLTFKPETTGFQSEDIPLHKVVWPESAKESSITLDLQQNGSTAQNALDLGSLFTKSLYWTLLLHIVGLFRPLEKPPSISDCIHFAISA